MVSILFGRPVGMEMICAPTISLCCQPKPLVLPYFAVSEAGAAAGVLWQARQAGLEILMGRAM